MPLGDSITTAAGWRITLQDDLRRAGYTFRMVGGRNDPLQPEGIWSEHGGSSGWTFGSFPFSQEFGGADVDWKDAQPDVVLLMIGTNDMQWGQAAGAPQQLEGLLAKIWNDVPNAGILVAQITPFSRVSDKPDGALLDPLVRQYNAAVSEIVAQKAAAGKKCLLVDQYTGFDPDKDLKDKCHPNESGHRKMANKWLEGIEQVTSRHQEYPDHPLPPIVSATAGGGRSQTIMVSEKVNLAGTVDDPGGKNSKPVYRWRKLYGPGPVTFLRQEQRTTTASFAQAGTYCLTFTAANGELEGRSNVRVIVQKASGSGYSVK